ncbi:hypothetical protein PanWU01x14_238230, partial [Parasponia andersonii]
ANVVLDIQLGYEDLDDMLVWHYDEKGACLAKSGYNVVMERRNHLGTSDNSLLSKWWKTFWHLKIPSKGERNEVVHGHRARNASCLLEDVELYLMEYKNIMKMKGLPTKSLVQSSSWEAPLVDHLKLNVNADVHLTAGWIGIEAVIQDSNGTICGAISSHEVEINSLKGISAIKLNN